MRIWKSAKLQEPVDVNKAGALRSTIFGDAIQVGETYAAMTQLRGRPEFERDSGPSEIRGAGPELIVVVSIDELVVSPLGRKQHLGNSITLQVRRLTVEKVPSNEWVYTTFRRMCQETSPAWASAEHPDEYWEKVMDETPSISAVGRNMGRYLPGSFWLNYFGEPFVRSLGMEKLMSAPTENVEALGDGVMIPLGDDPQAWDTPEYAVVEEHVRGHLGRDLFYSREDPDRDSTIDWLAN